MLELKCPNCKIEVQLQMSDDYINSNIKDEDNLVLNLDILNYNKEKDIHMKDINSIIFLDDSPLNSKYSENNLNPTYENTNFQIENREDIFKNTKIILNKKDSNILQNKNLFLEKRLIYNKYNSFNLKLNFNHNKMKINNFYIEGLRIKFKRKGVAD